MQFEEFKNDVKTLVDLEIPTTATKEDFKAILGILSDPNAPLVNPRYEKARQKIQAVLSDSTDNFVEQEACATEIIFGLNYMMEIEPMPYPKNILQFLRVADGAFDKFEKSLLWKSKVNDLLQRGESSEVIQQTIMEWDDEYFGEHGASTMLIKFNKLAQHLVVDLIGRGHDMNTLLEMMANSSICIYKPFSELREKHCDMMEWRRVPRAIEIWPVVKAQLMTILFDKKAEKETTWMPHSEAVDLFVKETGAKKENVQGWFTDWKKEGKLLFKGSGKKKEVDRDQVLVLIYEYKNR